MGRSLHDFLSGLPLGGAVRSKLTSAAAEAGWVALAAEVDDDLRWRRALSSRIQAELRLYLADNDPIRLAELAELIEALAELHAGGLPELAALRQSLTEEMGSYDGRRVLQECDELIAEPENSDSAGGSRPALSLPPLPS